MLKTRTTIVSLRDELTAQPVANEPAHTPQTEFDGVFGHIQTGSFPADTAPDFVDILRQFGYDPDRVQIIGNCRTSRWQRFDGQWLESYRFNLAPKLEAVDLPALYAEIARTEPVQLKLPTGESTVVVCWADIQTGKADHLGALQEQLARLEAKRLALTEYLEKAKFDHVIVADVGDIVEGFSNTTAQTRTNTLSLMDQVDVAATEFWKAIRLCAGYAPVDVLSIPSNHCQWRKRKDLIGKPTDDWGLHISKRLEKQNEDAGLPVAFYRPEDWDETLQFDIRGTRLGLAHGHQAANPDKVKDWWAKMTHAGVLDCHVLLTGHFHFPSLRPCGKDALTGRSRWHVQASTLDNGSAWVRNKYGEDGDPALTVFQVNDAGFDTSSFRLL